MVCGEFLLKAKYKELIVEYDKEHPKPDRHAKKERDPSELKRPQSAYFFFLSDFRIAYKVCHVKSRLNDGLV